MSIGEKLVRSGVATAAALAVGLLIYYPASPVGASYWKAAAHHDQRWYTVLQDTFWKPKNGLD